MHHPLRLRLIVAAAGLAATAAACAPPPSATPAAAPAASVAHPRLLIDREGIATLRDRIEHYPWARAQWDEVRAAADTLLSTPVALPPRGGTWTHWYVSPKDGQKMVTGRQIGPWRWEHVSPLTGEVFLGDSTDIRYDYDGVVILEIHRAWSRAVRDLGLAYQVTRDRRYADKAREVLLAYADSYLTYPLLNKQGGREMDGNGYARVSKQSISESSWLVPVVQGADLVWETLSPGDRRRVTERLFHPAARDVILPHRYNKPHNIQVWKNAAVGLVGLLTGDEQLVWEAVHNPREGYYYQLDQGVTPDGHWFERSPYYHFVTVEPLLVLAKAMEYAGLDPRLDQVKPLLDAPLDIALPDLTLPKYNDADPVDLRELSGFYEWAYARFGDPRYLRLLHASARKIEGPRAEGYTLLHGVPELPPAPPQRVASANYPATGFAILARGEGSDATWLGLEYDPFVSHGHYDRLGFELYGRGRLVSEDPGRTGYGAEIQNGWYKTTLSHNTLVVDEGQQLASEGRALAFGTQDGVDYVVLDAGEPYEGVTFRRTAALLDPDLVLFVDQVRSGRPALLDLAFHPNGEVLDAPAGQAWTPPDSVGYRYLRDATVREVGAPLSLRVRRPDGLETRVTYAIDRPSQLITAIGPGSGGAPVPTLLVRRRTASTTLPWAIALDGAPVGLVPARVHGPAGEAIAPEAAAAVRVTHPDGRAWLVVTNAERRPIRVELPGGATLETADAFVARRLR